MMDKRFYNKVAFYLVCGWAIIEMILCTVGLIGKACHTDNFLKGLCHQGTCGGYLIFALYARLAAVVFLVVGSFFVS